MIKKHFTESEQIGLGVFIRLWIENIDPFHMEEHWHSEYLFSGCLFDEMETGKINYGSWSPIMRDVEGSAERRKAERNIIFKKTRFKMMRVDVVPYIVKIRLVTYQFRNSSFDHWQIASVTVAKQVEGIWKACEYTWYYDIHYGDYLHLHPIRGEWIEVNPEAFSKI